MFLPFHILGVWFRGLLSVALLGAAAYLLGQWYNHRLIPVREPAPVARVEPGPDAERPGEARVVPPAPEDEAVRLVPWEFGLNRATAFLLGGLALLAWSLLGWSVPWLWLRLRGGGDVPASEPGASAQRLRRPDGTELHVEFAGPPDAPVLVLTHGWSLDADEWCYANKELAGRFRLITWDLPGLGRSTGPNTNDWSLEKLAGDLDAVVGLAGGRPVVLLGHSIGGMIILTYCRLFPEALGGRVKGVVIAQSTYTNPVKTAEKAGLYTALQKPVLEPLCHLSIWLSPLFRLLNWLSYLNGSAHRSTHRSTFSGRESWAQLDFITRRWVKASPAVLARGFLGMFRYDATGVLGRVAVPALVVAGDRDTTCRPEAGAYMAHSLPDARLLTLPDSRHGGLFEHHQRFHAAVEEFAAGCLAAGAKTEAASAASSPGLEARPGL